MDNRKDKRYRTITVQLTNEMYDMLTSLKEELGITIAGYVKHLIVRKYKEVNEKK